MPKPAARIGDMHSCPMITPGTGVPHVGGVIIGPGCGTVLIEGLPAATVGDVCMCNGDPDVITNGSAGVFIEGNPAARNDDICLHGGKVARKKGTVIIGGSVLRKSPAEIKDLSAKKKINATGQIIERCMFMLNEKLRLLLLDDTKTLDTFKKWFGKADIEAKSIIIERITKMLKISKRLSEMNFHQRTFEEEGQATVAEVYPDDSSYNIFIGINFWKAAIHGRDSRSGILAHELSHSNSIGKTVDYVRGEKDCIIFAESHPTDALFNADSFEYFIED